MARSLSPARFIGNRFGEGDAMVSFFAKVVANGQFVQGESHEVGFENWIEVLAYGWGGERGTGDTAGVRRMGRMSYGNLILRKRLDAATPLLFRAMDTNEICEVTLQLRKSGTGGHLENFMKITLFEAMMTGIKQGNLYYGGEMPEEEVSFSYQKINVSYEVQENRTGITRGNIQHESRMFQS